MNLYTDEAAADAEVVRIRSLHKKKTMLESLALWYEHLNPLLQFLIGSVVIRGIFARSLAGFIQKNIFRPVERPFIKLAKSIANKVDRAIARRIRDRKRKLIASSKVRGN